jgi:hypothetical protein
VTSPGKHGGVRRRRFPRKRAMLRKRPKFAPALMSSWPALTGPTWGSGRVFGATVLNTRTGRLATSLTGCGEITDAPAQLASRRPFSGGRSPKLRRRPAVTSVRHPAEHVSLQGDSPRHPRQVQRREMQGGPVSRETGPPRIPWSGLARGAGCQDIHDSVEILNAGELNAHSSLAGTQ